MNTEYQILLKRILKWKRRTSLYRILNTTVFLITRILVPTFSATIAANLSSAVSGNAFLNRPTMIAMSITVTVFSGLGIFIRPEEKKKNAFLTHNKLANLEEILRIEYRGPNDAPLLRDISERLQSVLDEYAQKGWGN